MHGYRRLQRAGSVKLYSRVVKVASAMSRDEQGSVELGTRAIAMIRKTVGRKDTKKFARKGVFKKEEIF
jgi:hypothetical protein